MGSLVVEWFKFAGAHGATGAVHGQALVTTTAWDPAPVGKLALCPLVALAKVETPANCLHGLHWACSMCWEPSAGATPDGGAVPAGVVVSLLGTGCCYA